jgi:geranylgeranyl diphosphate synthase type I
MDDMREGKRTLLIGRALKLATTDDASFLSQQLGNEQLTEADFERCKRIIASCGALEQTQQELWGSCEAARQVLQQNDLPDGDELQFLAGLTDFLMTRRA